MNKKILALSVVVLLLMAGCASQAPTPAAMMEAGTPTQEAMMENATATPEAMMENSTATPEAMMENSTATPEAMMATGMPGTGEMMGGTTTPEAMPTTGMAMTETMMATGTPAEMMMEGAWVDAALTDVNTGKSFKLSDFHGKTVLVELAASGSSDSLEQQKSLQAVLAGSSPDLVVVSLDVSAGESAADLKDHASMNKFQWSFAVAPGEVLQEIAKQYGSQYTDPANTPLLVIDPKGEAHTLPLKLTGQEQIKQAVDDYMPKM
jgi:hypothetical protein